MKTSELIQMTKLKPIELLLKIIPVSQGDYGVYFLLIIYNDIKQTIIAFVETYCIVKVLLTSTSRMLHH